MKTVYLFDAESGAYSGEYSAYPSPLEQGVFIAPSCSTEIPPPVVTETQLAVFTNGSWTLVDVQQTLPEVPSVPVEPLSVSAWQIRKALNQLELRDVVENAVVVADRETRDAWEYATEFRRDHSLVVSLGATLGKTSEELDALFSLAVTL